MLLCLCLQSDEEDQSRVGFLTVSSGVGFYCKDMVLLSILNWFYIHDLEQKKKQDVIIYSDHTNLYLIPGVSLFTARFSMITCIMC